MYKFSFSSSFLALALEFELMCPYTKVLRSFGNGSEQSQRSARGTGYGVPATIANRAIKEASDQKQFQRDQLELVFRVLAAYFSPSKKSDEPSILDALPEGLADSILSSTLIPVIISYLENDSGKYWCLNL